jgi:hypothetical protein
MTREPQILYEVVAFFYSYKFDFHGKKNLNINTKSNPFMVSPLALSPYSFSRLSFSIAKISTPALIHCTNESTLSFTR